MVDKEEPNFSALEAYETVPDDPLIWDIIDVSIVTRRRTKAAMKWLDDVEARILAEKENREREY